MANIFTKTRLVQAGGDDRRETAAAVMALVFQRRHRLCPIQMGIDSNSSQAGSDEDMAQRGEEEEEEARKAERVWRKGGVFARMKETKGQKEKQEQAGRRRRWSDESEGVIPTTAVLTKRSSTWQRELVPAAAYPTHQFWFP